MAKMMVRHNNFSVPKSGLFYDKKVKSNTLVIDDFGDYFEWMDKLQNNPRILRNPSSHKFKVKMGLSVVNHEDGDQFVRKVGFTLATQKLVEQELTLIGLIFRENGDCGLTVKLNDKHFFYVELGPRGRMMIQGSLDHPDSLYSHLYPRSKK